MHVPVIDFAASDEQRLSTEIDRALAEVGFMLVKNLGVDAQLLTDVYALSRAFFTGPQQVKQACAYVSAAENFGYQGLAQENLDPTSPADLKETFTMRNILGLPMEERRWPDATFKEAVTRLYTQALHASYRLQRVITRALDLEPEFFVRCHSGENVTLRLLYYPNAGVERIEPNQLGAGAHTDYGLLTLLFQDTVGGLQVYDANGQWQDVPPIPGAIVINSGDLLELWTNGRYKSTLHRVQPKIGTQDRMSIAVFVDPDSATEVSALDSCIDADHPARFAPTTAGEHLQRKIQASHKDRFA